jgi:hypothetical protein
MGGTGVFRPMGDVSAIQRPLEVDGAMLGQRRSLRLASALQPTRERP